MAAVALRARAELRARLRSWLGLGLLVGLVAGLAIAAAAGARRTESAYERFLVRQRAADVILDNYPDPGVGTVDPAAVERLPQVETSARLAFLFIGETGALAPKDARLGRDVDRLKVLEGRLPDPGRVDEMAVNFERARELHWGVGSTEPLIAPEHAAEARQVGVPNVRLRVVGIVASPGAFPPLEHGRPAIYLTPAFYRAYERTELFDGGVGHGVLARLRHGEADVPAFRAGVEHLSKGKPNAVTAEAVHARNVDRSLNLQAGALWVLAGLIAFTGAVVLSQTLSRQAFLEADEHPTLRAVGLTRRQLFAVGLLRALTVGAVGAAAGLAVALALSPIAPLGTLARNAEPDPGVAIDSLVFAVGGAATVLVTLLLAAPSAWAAARGAAERRGSGAGSPVATRLARLGAGLSVVTGVRMALEPGRGSSAIPVRTALVAITVGVVAFSAALTFGSSSDHLLDTPRLYGWNWDLALSNYGAGPDLARKRSAFAGDPAIDGASVGALGFPLDVNGRRVDGIGLDGVAGSVFPPIIDGRAPKPGEIALGAKTLRSLGLELGDSVRVNRPGAAPIRMRIVGRGVLAASFSGSARLAQGAILRYGDVRRLAPGIPAADAVVRLKRGSDKRAFLARLRRRVGDLSVIPRREPLDIVDFGRVRGLPLILASLLGLFAAATLAHVLATGVRRRRPDFAVLKALGFVRGQVRGVVLAQALTYSAVALLIGLPLGVAMGRFGWNVYADQQGIVEEVVVPILTLLAVVPAAALVAAGLALIPARWAAATRPAEVLRAE